MSLIPAETPPIKNLRFEGGLNCFIIDDGAGKKREVQGLSVCIELRHSGEAVTVVANYSPRGSNNGCWMIGIQNTDDGVAVPCWAYSFRQGACPYSPTLEIAAPEGLVMHVYADGDQCDVQ